MALVPKIDPNKIFASNAPSQDKPAAFDNYEKGMDETRKNLGRPTIPQLNYLHQTSDQKILWIHQNGGGLPYDASIEYAENAVTLKDGELKQLVGGAWVETKTKANATSITTANAQNQQQINDFGGAKWYAKVGGYELGATVKLDNGDTVQSTKSANTANPNVDMTGWKKDEGGVSATPSILTGVANTPNVTEFYNWNKITTNAAASKTDAGTNQQPNLIGWNVNLQEFIADGVQTLFTVPNSFPVVLNPAKEIVRVALLRKSDGARFPQPAGTKYSIAIDGSNNVNITFNTAPSNIYTVWIRVIGSTQNSNLPLLNFITNGYDNVTDGSGPMLEMTGAHHTELNNPAGHNTYGGGSYNQMINGCQYSYVGGHENHMDGIAFGFILGGRNYTKNSSGIAMFGQNNKAIDSTGALVVGYDHNFNGKPYSVVGGRGAIPIASGGISIGNGKSGDAEIGIRQFDIFGLSKTTTDATEGFLSQNSGTSLNVINVNSAAFITAEVIATSSDNLNQKTFTMKACIKRVGGVCTIIGAPTVVSEFATSGAADWNIRFQVASNGVYLRPTGVAATTIRWMAKVSITATAFNAA